MLWEERGIMEGTCPLANGSLRAAEETRFSQRGRKQGSAGDTECGFRTSRGGSTVRCFVSSMGIQESSLIENRKDEKEVEGDESRGSHHRNRPRNGGSVRLPMVCVL